MSDTTLQTPLTVDDPRLTAFALGELDGARAAQIAAAVQNDPSLAAEVAAIQATAGDLTAALASTGQPRLGSDARAAIAAAAAPKRRLRLVPALSAGVLAAAGVAVAVLVQAPAMTDRKPARTTMIKPQAASHQDSNDQRVLGESGEVVVTYNIDIAGRMIDTGGMPASGPVVEYESEDRLQAAGQTEIGGASAFGAIGSGGRGDGRMRREYRSAAPAELRLAARDLNHEGYTALGGNAFRATAVDGGDASTFSIDVDTASYTNMRRMLLREQRMPPKEAVRIEEMLNYFRYAYAPPATASNNPFAVAAETTACPWNADHRLVRVGIQGAEIDRTERPASNLVFLIDTSGSMQSADKLQLLVQGFHHLVAGLDSRDRVAIVTYAGSAGLVLPSTSGDQHATINGALSRLRAGGSTNGGAGLSLAYATARQHFIDGGTNRVILATDGDFNVGTTSAGSLVDTVKAQAQGGIQMTVLGFGTGNLQDGRMEQLSNDGDGVYHYIDSERESQRVFGEGLTGTLVTIARDVKIQVFFNPAQVAGWRLVGYQNRRLAREDFNNDQKGAGEIGAGHQVTALYEIVPAGRAVPGHIATDPNPFVAGGAVETSAMTDPNGPMLRLRLRHKLPGADRSTLQEFDLADSGRDWLAASADTRWAAAVAGAGMRIRGEDAVAAWSWEAIRATAVDAVGSDPRGDRREFIQMIDTAMRLQPDAEPIGRHPLPGTEGADNELRPVTR